MKIVLFQPQIPQNTGNIARTCSVTGSGLVLVHPLGFSTNSRHLKRAGLDYWEGVNVEEIFDLSGYLHSIKAPFFFFSSKSEKLYTDAPYTTDSLLIFGSEDSGIPQPIWEKWKRRFYTIPMLKGARCLNLSTSVSIVLYEALRQTHFEGLRNSEATRERTTLINSEDARGM